MVNGSPSCSVCDGVKMLLCLDVLNSDNNSNADAAKARDDKSARAKSSSVREFAKRITLETSPSSNMKTTWKDIAPVPNSQEFLDIVLSRTQRRLPTQIRFVSLPHH